MADESRSIVVMVPEPEIFQKFMELGQRGCHLQSVARQDENTWRVQFEPPSNEDPANVLRVIINALDEASVTGPDTQSRVAWLCEVAGRYNKLTTDLHNALSNVELPDRTHRKGTVKCVEWLVKEIEIARDEEAGARKCLASADERAKEQERRAREAESDLAKITLAIDELDMELPTDATYPSKVNMIVDAYCGAHNESMAKTDRIAVLHTQLRETRKALALQEAGESDQIMHANSMMDDAKVPEAARWETRLQSLIDDRDDLRKQLEEALDDMRLVNNALSGSSAPSAPIHDRVRWLVDAVAILATINIQRTESGIAVSLDSTGAGGTFFCDKLEKIAVAVEYYQAQRKELGV